MKSGNSDSREVSLYASLEHIGSGVVSWTSLDEKAPIVEQLILPQDAAEVSAQEKGSAVDNSNKLKGLLAVLRQVPISE